ncbi:putative nuclear lim interactor-interacting factor (nli-interacting factor) (nli-if) [Schistosoma mansoni]|uniref:putative nuclear lim interactor-interacting factor (nli-interacting factor) (nli-if) n=1 Tax=Schistosoma mansoni TaxID=6183 RepID=UPI0001A63234|nr:putative nuclear lim interactor-interacting factor (nli-interacting factor) (nli-if) [Schistosoma mansoni]|eukprot:XP_018648668.1 putative nuclear lim interactor-interacting factor (nli-interacting factor) (nli-if) [Schistosoma mansoni]
MDGVLYQNKKPYSGDDMSSEHCKSPCLSSRPENGNLLVPVGQKSLDIQHMGDISSEEYERLVLSPPPVPLSLEAASAAIYEAACRSHSRTQSISDSTRSLKTIKHEGYTDSHSNCSARSSAHEISKQEPKEVLPCHTDIKPTKPGNKWRRFLCCFPDKACHPSPSKQKNSSVKGTSSAKSQSPIDGKSNSNEVNDLLNKKSTKPAKSGSKKRSRKSKGLSVDDTVECKADQLVPPSPTEEVPIPTVSIFQPVLPSTVLNALGSKADSSIHSASVSNGYSFNDPDVRIESTVLRSTVGISVNTSKSHYPFQFTALKRHTSNDVYGTKLTDNAECQNPTTQVENTNGIESSHHVIHQQSQPLHSPWVECDHPDGNHFVSDSCPHDQYSINYDRNSGQGDASSENLDPLPPGIDLLGEVDSDCVNKKCLVLDLDETLVHSSFKYVENADFVVPVEINGTVQQVYVRKRPYLDKFLKAIGPLFECVMFTASLRKYADPVCDYIDASSYFRHRLFREACVDHQCNLIKDLSRLGRDVEQICIVDNSPISFLFQPSNALQIVSWFGDLADQALCELIPYLTGLASARTVVDYLREFRPPQNAAVAQPATPTWLLLFNHSLPGDMNTLEDSEGGELEDDDIAVNYHDEDAVLSPHYSLNHNRF